MIMRSNNSSEFSERVSDFWLYGIPSFKEVENCCVFVFKVHSYVYSIGNVMVYIYGMILFIRYAKTLLRQPVVLAILVLTMVSETCNVLFLIIDPYGYLRKIPVIVLGLLWKITDIIIPWNFFFVHFFVSKQTRLDISTFEFRNNNMFWIFCVLESTCVISFEIIASFQMISFPLTVCSDIVFTLFAFFLLSYFIYGAPQLSQYVRETKKARLSFNEFNSSRKREVSQSQTYDSYQNRLNFPKIRRSESSFRKISLISMSVSSLIEQKSTTRNTDPQDTYPVQRPSNLNIRPIVLERKTNSPKQKVEPEIFPYEDCDDTSGGSVYSNDQLQNTQFGNTGVIHTIPTEEIFDTFTNDVANIDKRHCNSCEPPVDNVLHSAGKITYNSNEQGYLADSECISNLSNETIQSKTDSKQSIVDMKNTPNFNFATLPTSTSYLSMYRVRQQKLLQRLLKVCYIQSFFLGLSITCKVYIIFSGYGGIFYKKNMKPVTWLVFIYLQRLLELAIHMVYTVGVHFFTTSKSSYQMKKDRKKTSCISS